MIRHKQLCHHRPEDQQYGDCHRTAIACLLDIAPGDVPHFLQLHAEARARGEEFSFFDECEKFLNSRGFTQCDVLFNCPLDELFLFMQSRNQHVLYLLGGQSVRGVDHTVICRGGGFEWDPHPDNNFVRHPLSNGFYEVTFLLPLSMKANVGRLLDGVTHDSFPSPTTQGRAEHDAA